MKQLAPNVWQLSVFPPNGINVYMIEDVLIDAASKWAKRRVMRQIDGKPLSMVALTHAHPDHQGVAKYVCEQRGVPLAVHEADVPAMDGREQLQSANPNHVMNRLSRAVFAGPPYKVERVLQDGDEVAGFKVVHAPGHTKGEVIFFRESDRVAIVGDVLANMNVLTGRPGLHEMPGPYVVDVEQSRDSVRKLLDLQPALICFGHGAPLRDLTKLERFVSEKI